MKQRLQSMDDWEFEHFVADLWERQGWTTEVESQSADAGVDVRATKTTPYDQKMLIQAKRYSSNTTVSGPDVQQYAALKQQEPNVDKVVIVTTSSFSRAGRERASELNVKLVNGDDLVELVKNLEAEDLVWSTCRSPLRLSQTPLRRPQSPTSPCAPLVGVAIAAASLPQILSHPTISLGLRWNRRTDSWRHINSGCSGRTVSVPFPRQ